MHIVDIMILAGWIAFWIYWLVAATRARARPRSGRAGVFTRFAGMRVVVLLILLLLVRLRVFKGPMGTSDPWLLGVGTAVFALGLGLAVWARVYLGRNWGMPMNEAADPDLVTTGPYHRVRHPIYSGIILGMIGTAVAVSLYWLIAVALLGAYFIYSAVMEERYMSTLFPDAYPSYKRSTKMLIPFIL